MKANKNLYLLPSIFGSSLLAYRLFLEGRLRDKEAPLYSISIIVAAQRKVERWWVKIRDDFRL